jgi:redox-sensitive bicupin YhaK (pirin superfamily)
MSNPFPEAEVEPCVSEPESAPTVEELPGRLSDLGGLPIRRFLPRTARRLVGPWCFLDAYGPLSFSGKPMDVAPHPHMGLQTVSWLLEGEVFHNDSLGLTATARPGALNLMTAGRGIAHSEETPNPSSGRLHGVQLWMALPNASRETAPSFEHHPELPVLELDSGAATVFAGELGGVRSPATTFSPIVGGELSIAAHRRLEVPLDPGFEHALVPLRGALTLDARPLSTGSLYYLGCGRREVVLRSEVDPARALLLGGAPFGESVLMWWNFVARTNDELAAARDDWQAGRRFGEVRAYPGDRLEARAFVPRR